VTGTHRTCSGAPEYAGAHDPTAWSTPAAGNRRAYRLVKGPQPGAKFLVRVAALGRDGVMAEWSDPVLVTAC
jgi:hypothetical protein